MTASAILETPAARPGRDDAYVTRLELVNRLALLAASSLDLAAVLKTIAQELRAAFRCYSVSIAMVVDEEMLAFQATDSVYGFWDAEELKTRRHRLDGPSGMARALRKGSLLYIPNAAHDPQHTPSPVLPLARCELATPLIAGGETVGGITALGDRPEFFGAADAQLMEAVAPHAAAAVRNAKVHTTAQHSLAQLAALHEISADIVGELEQQELLNKLSARSKQLLGGTSGGIYLWDENAEVLWLKSAANPLNVGVQLKPGEGVSGRVFQTGQPLIIADYQAWAGRAQVFDSSGLRSVIAVPLNYRQKTIGVLTVSHNSEPGRFKEADASLLTLFANQAAAAIINARLFEETREKAQEVSKLYAQANHILRQMRFFNEVSHGLDLEEPLGAVLQTVADRIRQTFDYPYVDIALADHESLIFQASSSDQPGYTRLSAGHRVPLNEPRVMAQAVLKRKTYYAPITSADPYYNLPAGHHPTRSEVAVPIQLRDTVIGVLNLESREPNGFGASDIALAEALAVQLAAIIQNANLIKQLNAEQHQLEAVQQTSAEVASELDLPALLQQVAVRSMQLLEATGGGLYLWEAANGVLRQVASTNPERIGAAVKPGEGASGLAFQRGEPLIIEDYETWPGRSVVFDHDALRAVIAMPLVYRQQTIGVLTLSYTEKLRAFAQSNIKTLSLFANQAAAAIVNARLFEETRDKAREIRALYEQASRILRQLRFFNEVSHGLDLEGPLDAVLQTVADRIQQTFDYPYVDIALVNSDQQTLSYRASSSSQPGYTLGVIRSRLPLSEPRITTQAVLTRSTYYAPDTSVDPYYRAAHGRLPTASELAVPIMQGGRVIGALNLEHHTRNSFSESDIALAEALAVQLAVIIQNADLIAQLNAERQQLEAVQQTSIEVISELELPRLLRQLIEQAKHLLGGTGGGVYLWEKEAGVLQQAASTTPERIGAELKPGEGASGLAFQRGEPVIVADYQAWPGRSEIFDRDTLRAVIAMPLVYHQETIGVLTLSHTEKPGAFVQSDIKTLSLFANQAAIAIANARLFRAEREQAALSRKLYDDANLLLGQLRFFNEVTQYLKVDGSLNEKLQEVADRIHRTFGYPFVDIALLEGDALIFGASSSDEPAYLRENHGYRLPLSERRITTQAVLARSTYYAADTSTDPYYRMPYGYFPTGSELAVPIMLGEQVIGTMNLEHRQRDAFSKSDIALVEALAVQLAAIIQNARLIEQLNAEQQQLASTLDQIADGLLTVRAGGQIVALNAKAARLLATTAEAALGRSCDDLLPPPEKDQPLAAIVARAAAERRTVSPGEHWLTLSHAPLPDQTLTVSLAPLSNAPAGEAPAVLVALWDVTARAQVDRLRSELVSNVSHELRTPLTRMRLRAEQVQSMHSMAAPGQEAFAAMLADILLLERLVTNILQATRIEGGQIALQRQPVALGPLARQIARESGQGERFTLELAADTPLADGDPHRVHEVLTNLVNNAIQYSPAGSPITIRTGAAADGMALVSVRDHGEGVPEADRARIFTRFYRVQRDNARAAYGSGLGLYIARGYVEAHGGRIWVESEEGAGSVFHFTLPAYTHNEDEHDPDSDR